MIKDKSINRECVICKQIFGTSVDTDKCYRCVINEDRKRSIIRLVISLQDKPKNKSKMKDLTVISLLTFPFYFIIWRIFGIIPELMFMVGVNYGMLFFVIKDFVYEKIYGESEGF